MSLPSWLHKELARSTPLHLYAHLLLCRPASLGLNVHPQSSSPHKYAESLRAQGLDASVSTIAPHGVVLHSRPRDVSRLPGLREGYVHVQDVVQQSGVSWLAPLRHQGGGRLLDACAAPGGKTRAFLCHREHRFSRVLALERSPAKAEELREAFSSDGRLTVVCADAADASSWWDGEMFDAIIADVPCSATGIMRSRPEVKVHQVRAQHLTTSPTSAQLRGECNSHTTTPTRYQTAQSVRHLRKAQLAILRSVWPLLRPRGQLLYTTCSLLPIENDDLLRTFVADDHVRASFITPHIPTDSDEEHLIRKHGVTFLPTLAHEGGFAALLQKHGDSD